MKNVRLALHATASTRERYWRLRVRPCVKKALTASMVATALGMAGGMAQSRSLQVAGSAGYLSEWELNGAVKERISSAGTEYFRH
jgi:hypothetical protein